MKIKSLLTAAMAGLMLLSACKEGPADTPDVPSAKDLTIKFSASLYGFTKATDTAFENGDQIGVNIFNPECWLYNGKYTYNNGALTAAVAKEWYEDTELEATITAVYPFSETLEGFAENQTFMVYADQSAKTGYASSDLMLAVTKSKPTEEAVKLPFKHALSKIVITVDNQLGEDIAQLWFTDVLGTVTYKTADPLATLEATGSAGTVKAYKSGENTWQLIVAPQTASPKLALTTASGKQFTYVLDENVTFSSGKVSSAAVTVSTESIYTSFTPEIEDWVADNELNFNQKDDEEVVLPEDPDPIVPDTPETKTIYLDPWQWISDNPRLEAYFFGGDIEEWITMTDADADGIFECSVPEGATTVIFVRMDSTKEEHIWDSKWNQTEDLVIPADKNCFTITAWDGGAKGESLGAWSVR